MNPKRRSPWHGLTGRQALEVADTLSMPEYLTLVHHEALWLLHITYARRATAALAGNDLRNAIDCAEMATAVFHLWEREADRHPEHIAMLNMPAPATPPAPPALPARLDHLNGLAQ